MNKYNFQRALFNTYPKCEKDLCKDDDRFGGFFLPFIAGAIISAPAWYVIGENKGQSKQMQQPYYPGYYPQYNPYYYPPYNQPYAPY